MSQQQQQTTKLSCDFTPPSNNVYYRSCNGRVFISAAGRQFKKKVKKACAGKPKILGPIGIHLLMRWPDKRKRDLDNYFKAIFDATKNVLFEDDDMVMRIFAEKKCGNKEEVAGFDMTIIPIVSVS